MSAGDFPTQDEWHAHVVPPTSAATAVIGDQTPKKGKQSSQIKSLATLLDECQAGQHATPPEIIGGVLHRGCKMLLGGHSKANKSWALLDLGIKVAAGANWWGFPTVKGRVLFLNFELPEWAIKERIMSMLPIVKMDGVNIKTVTDGLDFWNLRGEAADLFLLLPRFKAAIESGEYALIIIDPLYKMLGDADENSAGDMASIFNELEELAAESQAALVVSHHFAKGNASGKAVQDRMSGSGVMARDVDAMIVLTPHEDDGAFVAEFVLRHFAAPKPFALRLVHPFLVRDDSMDATKLKTNTTASGGGGAKKLLTTRDVVAAIGAGNATFEAPLVRLLASRHEVSPKTATARIMDALQSGEIVNTSGGYRIA